jgi:hypothetical protein
MIHKTKDASFKNILANNELFACLIRDFIDIEELKGVKPEDISDESGRFLPLDREATDSDTVKRIRLPGADGAELYVVAIVEHQSTVDQNIAARLFHYMDQIYSRNEKAHKHGKNNPRTKQFRYPPLLPVVLYDGEAKWTAARDFRSRIALGDVFGRFNPQFEYTLIDLNEKTVDDLVRFRDALSFLLILDKVRSADGIDMLSKLPADYLKMVAGLPGSLKGVVEEVLQALLTHAGAPEEAIDHALEMVEPRKEASTMFEALQRDIDAREARWQAKESSWQTERDTWQTRETAWKTERDAWQDERDTWKTERSALQNRIAELEGRH